jgi:3-oxosteroid 1-dehydrogenase
MSEFQRSVDFVVMGSGAAAMAGALRAHDLGNEVLVLEKTELLGGNSAMSGGVCWVANNPDMRKRGMEDSDEDGLAYLEHITKGEVERERLEAYIRESKRMVTYMEEHSHLRFESLDLYTDYYAEAPGGRPGGRSMEPAPFDGSLLREDLMRLRRPHTQSQILGKFGITARQAHLALVGNWRTKVFMLVQMLKFAFRYFKRAKWGRDTALTAGNALIGRLLLSLKDRGVPCWTSAPVVELVQREGRVVGVVVEKDGERIRVEARKGVLMGAGGFSRDQTMREEYGPRPIHTDWTAGAPANTGDGIKMGMALGSPVALMDEAWWTPVSLVPRETSAWVLVVEKSLPHGIFVNEEGERFTNESAPYIDVVHGMYADVRARDAAAPRFFHVFDATYRHNSVAGPVAPGYAMPDSALPRRFRDGYLHRAATLDELAQKIGVPADALKSTVERFNGFAPSGVDPDFHRGETAQDRYYGDPRCQPNPCVGAIEKGPFYAIEIYPGDLGTKGGLVTDVRGRVLGADGAPIAGLYAAGNTTASVMGRTYPGAGGTIGPALTFGFLAAEAAHEDAGLGTNGVDAAAQ